MYRRGKSDCADFFRRATANSFAFHLYLYRKSFRYYAQKDIQNAHPTKNILIDRKISYQSQNFHFNSSFLDLLVDVKCFVRRTFIDRWNDAEIF